MKKGSKVEINVFYPVVIKALFIYAIYSLPNIMLLQMTTTKAHSLSSLQDLALIVILLVAYYFLLFFAQKTGLVIWQAKNLWQHKKMIILGIIGMLLANIALPQVFAWIGQPVATGSNEQLLEQMTAKIPFFMTILFAVFLAPLAEELIFRVGIIRALPSYPKFAYIFSSLIFAFFHMVNDLSDWKNWLIYAAAGFVLGAVYMKSEKVETNIAVHMAWNLISIFL